MLDTQKTTVPQVAGIVRLAPPPRRPVKSPMKEVGDHLFRFWLEEAFWKDFESSLAL